MAIRYEFKTGKYQNLFSESLRQVADSRFLKRLWKKDGSLWSDDPAHHAVALNRLGWLNLPSGMEREAARLEEFASKKVFRKFDHIVHLGMGGSSLAPEVFFRTFGNAADYPELIVLDSTDPDQIETCSENHPAGHDTFHCRVKIGFDCRDFFAREILL